MKYIIISICLLGIFIQLPAQNLATCTEKWCFDKDGNVIADLRFDPNTIKWPIHFSGKTVKQADWILVKYQHHDKVDVVSLQEYRSISNIPMFCENGVELHPPFECEYGNSGKPRYVKAQCSLVGVSHEEREIRLGVGSCFKKVIDWTVIDWCTYDPKKDNLPDNDNLFLVKDLVNGYAYYAYNDSYGKLDRDGAYHYQQVIHVGDVEQPELMHLEKIKLSASNNCLSDEFTVGNRATDKGRCPSESFKWTATLYEKGKKPEILEHTLIGSDSVTIKLKGLSVGEHKILWRVTDGCNNPQEDKQVILISDSIAPNIFCKGSFSVGVGSPGDPIAIWTNDFVKSVEDNCTMNEKIILSFAKDSVVTSLDLTCESHFGESELAIYASDERGNQSYCLVRSRFVSDNDDCQRDLNFVGQIHDESGNPYRNVELILETSKGEKASIYSDINGNFSIDQKISISARVFISLAKNIEKGHISTFDLVAIQKHILDLEKITNVYKLAAADVNADGDVNAEDINFLRKYLLGISNYSNSLDNRLLDLKSGRAKNRVEVKEGENSFQFSIVSVGDVID